jgi:uncharacterized protein (TIGR00255 family)
MAVQLQACQTLWFLSHKSLVFSTPLRFHAGTLSLLLSMTGHGQASMRHGDISIDVEIRTVNNRFLKVVSKVSDIVSAIDPQIEGVVRDYLKRGSINVFVRVSQSGRNNASTVNQSTLENYVSQAKLISEKLGIEPSFELGQLLLLPGVLESTRQADDEELLAVVREALNNAILDLQAMRAREGHAMALQFEVLLDQIREWKSQVEARAPIVISEYRTKFEQRIRTSLANLGHQVEELDLLREVLVFADRCDVSEEITRLGSHLTQFQSTLAHAESQGRRLDFLIQELFREANTIGSKANDSLISQFVVSIKTTIEQMRELVQNVE